MPTARLPVVIFGAKLLGWLPYPAARFVWLGANVLALVIFVLAWPGIDRSLMAVAMAWSMPVGLLLVLGRTRPSG